MVDSICPTYCNGDRFDTTILDNGPGSGEPNACGTRSLIRSRAGGCRQQTCPRSRFEFFEFVLSHRRGVCYGLSIRVVPHRGRHQSGKAQQSDR